MPYNAFEYLLRFDDAVPCADVQRAPQSYRTIKMIHICNVKILYIHSLTNRDM